MSLRGASAVLSAEVAAIRRRDPDLDAGDITTFTLPLLLRLVGVLAVGLVPLLVIRSSGDTDALLVPLVGSLALAIICTAVVAWLVSIVISGLVVMVLYRTGPRASSQVVVRTLTESFERVSDATSHIMLLALVLDSSRWRSACPLARATIWPIPCSRTCSPLRSRCCSRRWGSHSSPSRSVVPQT